MHAFITCNVFHTYKPNDAIDDWYTKDIFHNFRSDKKSLGKQLRVVQDGLIAWGIG